MKRILIGLAGIALFVAIVILYNFSFWLFEGDPRIPGLESRWWSGYYETQMFSKQWCVAHFSKSPSGIIQMALISPWGPPDVFNVKRTSSDKNFVHLTFTSSDGMRIEAKQLYIGKKYMLQRLMVGRIKYFWKKNEDISIRGKFVSISPPQEFAIEPIRDEELAVFWRRYVRPDRSEVTPQELLEAVGFPTNLIK